MKLLRITTVPVSLQVLLTGQFRYMADQGYDVFTVSASGPEVDEVLKEGVRHIAVPFTRKITPLQDLKCLIQLIRIIREIRPDIIHTHTPKAGLLGMLAGWICGVPLRMHTVAGLPLMEAAGLKRKLLEGTERLTYFCAHKVYPNSGGLRDFMVRELGTDAGKLKVIGSGSSNGIDIGYFRRSPELAEQAAAIRKKNNIGVHDIVFSFVGRIVRDKGIVELEEAFRTIAAGDGNAPRMFLLLVGSFERDLDPLPDDILKFLREDPRVILAGYQRDVRPWLMASDIFVFPSYREGFPNVVMQASLLGIPCIVSDINGCNEIVTGGETGLIVKPKDVASLSAAMLELVRDESGRQRFSALAYAFVSTHFARERVWDEIRKEYESHRTA